MRHVQQSYTGECLAACAAMAYDYLDMPQAYNYLIEALGIERGIGAPFSNVHNLTTTGVTTVYRRNGSLEELYMSLMQGQPPIAGVQTRELSYWNGISASHVVLVVGMDSTHVFLHDPEMPRGPVQVRLAEFDLAWLEQGERYAVLMAA